MAAADMDIPSGSHIVLQTVAVESQVQAPATVIIGAPRTHVAPRGVDRDIVGITAMSTIVVGAIRGIPCMCIATHLVSHQETLEIGITATHVDVTDLEVVLCTGRITFQLQILAPAAVVIRPAGAPSVPVLWPALETKPSIGNPGKSHRISVLFDGFWAYS